MKLQAENTDAFVLAELGRRLARTRLERNVSQADLAHEAGVSKSTVERLEAGDPVKLDSFIRLLRALGQLDVIDQLLPEPLPSPIERLQRGGKQRRRAGGGQAGASEPAPWTWGTGPEAGSA